MKRISILLMFVASVALTSCSMLQSSATNSVALASGQACGSAVQGLYSAYRNSGTIDLTNATNLSNALALATSYTSLKENKDNSNFRKSFTSGLIASSAGLITSNNASTFVDTLLKSAGLSNVTTKSIAQTATTASTIISLLNTLKQ